MQMALDVLYRSIESGLVSADQATDAILLKSLRASDIAESDIATAPAFLEHIYGGSESIGSRTNSSATGGLLSRPHMASVRN